MEYDLVSFFLFGRGINILFVSQFFNKLFFKCLMKALLTIIQCLRLKHARFHLHIVSVCSISSAYSSKSLPVNVDLNSKLHCCIEAAAERVIIAAFLHLCDTNA